MLIPILKRVLPTGSRRWLRRTAEFVYKDVDAVVAEKSIVALGEKDLRLPPGRPEIIEVSADTNVERYFAGLSRADGILGSRKARRYLSSGFRGFAAIADGKVLGAVWSARRGESTVAGVHRDLQWLKLGLAEDEAYMFDMFIEPDHRGLAMCTALFRAGFRGLRSRGVTRVRGYYVRDYLPALWMHRMAGYREVGRVRVRRVLGLTLSYSFTPLEPADGRLPVGDQRNPAVA